MSASSASARRPAPRRRPITDAERHAWAEIAQLGVLDALMSVRSWGAQDIAFHGGTSLHFSWASPRFSEDLDFLLAHPLENDLGGIMERVQRRMRDQLMRIDPKLDLEIRNKTSKLERMGNFHIVVTHADVLERVMVKAEFWSVDQHYLSLYPTEFRTPVRHGDIVAHTRALVPAATLVSSIADKITALAGRPYLKWRDIFDIWWVTTQTRGVPTEPGRIVAASVIDQYLHNRSAYATQPGWAGVQEDAQKLHLFAQQDAAPLVDMATRDLRPFLPRPYWDGLCAQDRAGIKQIVQQAQALAADVVQQLQQRMQHVQHATPAPAGHDDHDDQDDSAAQPDRNTTPRPRG